MSSDREHGSHPQLYGSPPPAPRRGVAVQTQPPVGHDDLPIETFRSPEDEQLALQLLPRSYTSQVIRPEPKPNLTSGPRHGNAALRGRPLVLRALAGRLLRPKGD